jgi:tRNA-2-methylthio-N6-dimethylallyladenosine synthase
LSLLDLVNFDAVFAFQFSPRPNTPAISLADSVPEDEKSRRLQRLMDRQREIQRVNYAKHIGEVMEAAVEGFNTPRGQVKGRSSQNKTVNFTTTYPIAPAPGSYVPVRITQSFPNSLVGEAVS